VEWAGPLAVARALVRASGCASVGDRFDLAGTGVRRFGMGFLVGMFAFESRDWT